MDRCQQVRNSLADYRTGILSLRKSAWLEEHLEQCSGCANELRVLDDVLTIVDANTPDHEPPAGLWNGVYNRITSPEPAPVLGRDLKSRPNTGWTSKPVRAAGVGVAALALAIGLILGTGRHDTNAPVQIASSMEYVQGHALYAGQAPLADRVSYLSVVAASSESNGK